MQVMKKDGKLVDFDPGKIVTSFVNAANDANIQLNSSDIHEIKTSIIDTLKNIRDDGFTTSYEISGVTLHTLISLEFKDIAKGYFTYNMK